MVVWLCLLSFFTVYLCLSILLYYIWKVLCDFFLKICNRCHIKKLRLQSATRPSVELRVSASIIFLICLSARWSIPAQLVLGRCCSWRLRLTVGLQQMISFFADYCSSHEMLKKYKKQLSQFSYVTSSNCFFCPNNSPKHRDFSYYHKCHRKAANPHIQEIKPAIHFTLLFEKWFKWLINHQNS